LNVEQIDSFMNSKKIQMSCSETVIVHDSILFVHSISVSCTVMVTVMQEQDSLIFFSFGTMNCGSILVNSCGSTRGGTSNFPQLTEMWLIGVNCAPSSTNNSRQKNASKQQCVQ